MVERQRERGRLKAAAASIGRPTVAESSSHGASSGKLIPACSVLASGILSFRIHHPSLRMCCIIRTALPLFTVIRCAI